MKAQATVPSAGRVQALEQNAGSVSFMSKVFGTDCYTKVLSAVRIECRHLGHDGKTRLAISFANCHHF